MGKGRGDGARRGSKSRKGILNLEASRAWHAFPLRQFPFLSSAQDHTHFCRSGLPFVKTGGSLTPLEPHLIDKWRKKTRETRFLHASDSRSHTPNRSFCAQVREKPVTLSPGDLVTGDLITDIDRRS